MKGHSMYRKVRSLTLVVTGLLFVVAGFANASANLEQAKSSIISLINDGKYADDDSKYTQAYAQTQNLISNFPKNPTLPGALYEIADKFRWAAKYEQVKNLYQQIIQNYPSSPYVSRAKLGLARVAVLSLIISKNYDQAEKDFNKLLIDFSGHPDLPETIYWIAERYQWALKYEQAINLYSQIAQNYPNSPWASNAKLGAARANILSLIQSYQYDKVKEPLDKMIADFAKHPDLPETLYWIARRYGWIDRYEEERNVYQQIIKNCPDSPYATKAEFNISRVGVMSLIMSQDYDGAEKACTKLVADFKNDPALHDAIYWIADGFTRSGQWEKANSLYQQIIQNYPDNSPIIARATFGLSITNVQSLIMSGKCDSADEAIDRVIADFAGQPYLADYIRTIGQSYYTKARLTNLSGDIEGGKVFYRKAIEVWERLIREFPDSKVVPNAYYSSAVCYAQELGEYQKGIDYFQKVVQNYPDYEYAKQAQLLAVEYQNKMANK
jgi:TolA-binding protein